MMTVLTGRDILRLNASQFAAAQQTLERAFFDYPLMVYACPDAQPRQPAASARSTRPSFTMRCVTARFTPSPGVEGSRLLAAARRPAADALPRDSARVCWGCRWPLAGRPFQCLLEYGQWHTKLHHEFTNGPHWFLATIGVDPASQGRGVGSALLEAITMRADEQRLPCYLETHGEKSARLYERHGFETVRLFEVPGHPIPVWAMLRPARNA